MLVYMLLNTIEERCYVGQTVKTAEARWKEHWDDARGGDSSAVHAAMRKWDDRELWWTYVVLQHCYSQEELDAAEAAWIEKCSAREPGVGYNARAERFVRSPRDARTGLTDKERRFYREQGMKGAVHGKKGARPRAEMTEAERERYREWGRKGAQRSKERQAKR